MPKSFRKLFSRENLTINIIVILLLLYFIYHTVNGKRGWIAYLNLSQSIQNKKEMLYELSKERQLIENKIKLLYPETLDIDLLDELARRELGLIEPSEQCIILKKPELENN